MKIPGITVPPDARIRILETAADIFAARGYRNVTVRDICAGASVNVAAVNYYFGGKSGLYLAVLKHCRAEAFGKFPAFPAGGTGESGAVLLDGFIRSFVFRVMGDGKESRFGKLMAREFIEPTEALDAMVEETIRPNFKKLTVIVGSVLGRPASSSEVRLCCASIVGQCLSFSTSRQVYSRLFGARSFTQDDLSAIADHIVRFSLAAIGNYEKGEKQ